MNLILSQARSAQHVSHSVPSQECPACNSFRLKPGMPSIYLILFQPRRAQHVSYSVQIKECKAFISFCPEPGVPSMYLILS